MGCNGGIVGRWSLWLKGVEDVVRAEANCVVVKVERGGFRLR